MSEDIIKNYDLINKTANNIIGLQYLELKLKRIEEKLDKVIDITQRYYDFWLHGTALEPIYKQFIDDLEDLKK